MQIDEEEDSDSFFSQHLQQQNLKPPAETTYEYAGKCCCYHKYFVPQINKYFIEHWEITKCFPIFVISTLISSYIIFLLINGPLLHLSFSVYFIETSLFILFLISYIQTIIEGPGYLPFYYPARSSYKDRGINENLSGMVTTREQEEYVKNNKHKLPKRAHFFHSARRIVIRPDHYCDWVASFIGKKNYKLFFLFNFYGFAYCAIHVITTLFCIRFCLDKKIFSIILLIFIFYSLLGFFFMLYTLSVILSCCVEITQNVTEWETLSKPNVLWDTSNCISNWEEIFGSIRKWYTWFIPIGAFHGVDEYELVYGKDAMTML